MRFRPLDNAIRRQRERILDTRRAIEHELHAKIDELLTRKRDIEIHALYAWEQFQSYAQTTIMYLLLLFVVVAITAGLSTLVYSLMYYFLVPTHTYHFPLYFDYGTHPDVASLPSSVEFLPGPDTALFVGGQEHLPAARVDVLSSYTQWYPSQDAKDPTAKDRLLEAGQRYGTTIQLDLPSSHTNQDIGVFMVSTALFSAGPRSLANCSRPVMLPYTSAFARTARSLFFALPLALGLLSEHQRVTVSCFDHFLESQEFPLQYVVIRLSHPRVQVRSASLTLRVELRGLRYYMYHWFLGTAFVGIMNLTLLQLTALALLAAVIKLRQGADGELQNMYDRRERGNRGYRGGGDRYRGGVGGGLGGADGGYRSHGSSGGGGSGDGGHWTPPWPGPPQLWRRGHMQQQQGAEEEEEEDEAGSFAAAAAAVAAKSSPKQSRRRRRSSHGSSKAGTRRRSSCSGGGDDGGATAAAAAGASVGEEWSSSQPQSEGYWLAGAGTATIPTAALPAPSAPPAPAATAPPAQPPSSQQPLSELTSGGLVPAQYILPSRTDRSPSAEAPSAAPPTEQKPLSDGDGDGDGSGDGDGDGDGSGNDGNTSSAVDSGAVASRGGGSGGVRAALWGALGFAAKQQHGKRAARAAVATATTTATTAPSSVQQQQQQQHVASAAAAGDSGVAVPAVATAAAVASGVEGSGVGEDETEASAGGAASLNAGSGQDASSGQDSSGGAAFGLRRRRSAAADGEEQEQ